MIEERIPGFAPDYSTWTAASRRFFRHPGALGGALALLILITAILLADLSPYDAEASSLGERLQPPSWAHPMGTDALGRDLLTRILYGGRVSLTVGVLVMAVTLAIGIPVGAVAGYFGGWVDNLLMRITDAALSLPVLLVLILLSAVLREVDIPILEQNSVLTIALAIGMLSWMNVARLVRVSFLSIRELEYVQAARALGSSNVRIMLRHILPNAIGPITVEATLEVGYAILEESGLSFLGFGIQPPTPSWGNLLGSAQEYLARDPWLALFPGLMIFLAIISINYVGDGLRDAFDPYKVLKRIGEV
jgi:peptide/nickel transport system permease protein